MVEAAMVGRDGVVNAASALDGRVSLNKAIVQMSAFMAAVPVPIIVAIADQYRDWTRTGSFGAVAAIGRVQREPHG
jgi:hypothetical protein